MNFKQKKGRDGVINFLQYREDFSNCWHVEFTINGTYGITGKGEAPQIFATVLKAIEDFIKDIKPKILEFSAEKDYEDESRASLYSRMLKKMAAGYGYNFKEVESSHQQIYTVTQKSSSSFADRFEPSK